MPKFSLDWCTRDWGGGSNYGPYSMRRAFSHAWNTRKEHPFARQAVTLVFTIRRKWQSDDYTFEISKPWLLPHKYEWPNWERFYDEGVVAK